MQYSWLKLRIILVAAILTALAGAFTATAWASAGRPFSGNICTLFSPGQMAAAEITGGCTQNKSETQAVSIYSAHWGANGPVSHYMMINITKPGINAELLYAVAKRSAPRGRSPINIGMWAYLGTKRYNGDHRRGDVMFRVGPYICHISLNDDNGEPDEVGIANALTSIAKTMAEALQ